MLVRSVDGGAVNKQRVWWWPGACQQQVISSHGWSSKSVIIFTWHFYKQWTFLSILKLTMTPLKIDKIHWFNRFHAQPKQPGGTSWGANCLVQAAQCMPISHWKIARKCAWRQRRNAGPSITTPVTVNVRPLETFGVIQDLPHLLSIARQTIIITASTKVSCFYLWNWGRNIVNAIAYRYLKLRRLNCHTDSIHSVQCRLGNAIDAFPLDWILHNLSRYCIVFTVH